LLYQVPKFEKHKHNKQPVVWKHSIDLCACTHGKMCLRCSPISTWHSAIAPIARIPVSRTKTSLCIRRSCNNGKMTGSTLRESFLRLGDFMKGCAHHNSKAWGGVAKERKRSTQYSHRRNRIESRGCTSAKVVNENRTRSRRMK
jgi:hypothetical protein